MPESEIALALADLRRALELGLTRIDGQLALLVQRSDQTDKELADLEARVTSLEKTRWPLPTLVALAAVASSVIVLIQTIGG
ncbi:hypothetical protein H9Y04_35245 [Streptomyces sp. TRM66268-LWL]|uniref:DUF3618 domain-containing protein n=1 Tax=Streptomyces polyasparticus TaxID=2767826 RepID=A0ABR7SQM5_9ACTN|nr:hypothetical protein [Streptomyces polyasparticus]MBC9717800.1 hypothetical protein [Streptomyces polyasparticus]